MRTARYIQSLAIVGAIVVLAALPYVLQSGYYTLILSLAAVYAVVGIGLNILAGYIGQVSLGHAGLYAVGAYVGAWLATRLNLSFWVIVPIVLLASMVVGAALAFPSLKLEGPYLTMVSISFGLIVYSVLVEWADVTGGTQGILHIPKISIGSFVFSTRTFYWLALFLVVVGAILSRNLRNSPKGQAMLAINDNELGAESIGLSPYRVKTTAFVISAAYAGLAGLLFAHLQGFISPEAFNLDASYFFITTVILGGLGSIVGPIVGSGILTYLPEVLQGFIDWRLIIYGALILFTLYAMPTGLVGAFSSLWSTAVRRAGRPGLAPRTGYASPENLSPNVKQPAVMKVPMGRRDSSSEQLPLLEVRSVTRAFGGLVAVQKIDLSVRANTVHALIGPNGAGKTVLLNTICAYYPPTSGEILFLGNKLTGRSPYQIARLGIARTFQTTQLFRSMPVVDNVITGTFPTSPVNYWDAFAQTRRLHSDRDQAHHLALELLELCGLYRQTV